MALYVGDNEISQKILLKGNVGVQLPTMSSDTEGQYLSNDGIQSVWKDEQIGYKQISNCITEIPQDIKLELNSDHTITLKAGSKLYIPNGFETDGTTRKFDTKIIESDINFNASTYATYQHIMSLLPTNLIQALTIETQQFSGDTAPTVTSTYAFWYDTANNIVKYTSDNGSSWTDGCSLPFGLVSITKDTGIISIDQVFNGFGFIGSILFVLPNVKTLAPNDINYNGTLNNVEISVKKIQIINDPDSDYNKIILIYNDTQNIRVGNIWYEQENKPEFVENSNQYWFNPKTNKLFYYRTNSNNGFVNATLVGRHKMSSSNKVYDFNINSTFQAINKNNSNWIAKQAMPSKKAIPLTLGASGTTYTAPANGYFSIDGQGPNWVDVAITNTGLNYGYCYASRSSDNYVRTLIPVFKGNKCQILFDTAFTNLISFNFIYAEGEL